MLVIELETKNVIEIELHPECAPNTVRNIRYLTSKRFYNGLAVYRTVKNKLVQIGCPKNIGKYGPGYTIFGEFEANGFKNSLPGKRGNVFAGRYSDNYNSNNSQFFINQRDIHELNGNYTGFGSVVKGMDVVDWLSEMETYDGEHPIDPIIITRMYLKDDYDPIVVPDKMPKEFSQSLKFPIFEENDEF
ncbi:MAG: peptidylprolyl isomerase [Bacillota bacterium]|nr:peptidylprolyl isomerase [Bacillota bacterium]